MFDSKGKEVRQCKFPTGGNYTSSIRQGSFELHGDRVITLGMNMYDVKYPEKSQMCTVPSVKTDDTPDPLATEELNLLARLMGSMKTQIAANTEPGFRLNLFMTDLEQEEAGASGGPGVSVFGVLNIQAIQDLQSAAELAHIAGQFAQGEKHLENQGSSKGDELLALMDDL
ncbi:protein OSCP1-like [Thalassophryne amazonica]|uniref:protein OSCP1-like n=1 Tax=Thalassophryne amazonica TaxID=390379 RepID=UPI0014710719|nr:protein OSCP1-like [Thalassophryne amazonica]